MYIRKAFFLPKISIIAFNTMVWYCSNLMWILLKFNVEFLFDLLTRILKLASACTYITITIQICGLNTVASPHWPQKYTSVIYTEVWLKYQKLYENDCLQGGATYTMVQLIDRKIQCTGFQLLLAHRTPVKPVLSFDSSNQPLRPFGFIFPTF